MTQDSSNNRPILPAVGFLSELPEEARNILSTYGEFIEAEEGTQLITEGEDQESLYLLLSGALHVTRENEGRRTLLWRADAGDTFGEVNLFDPGVASADVTAMGPVHVWRTTRTVLDAFVDIYPKHGAVLLVGIAKLLSQRLRSMNERFVTLQEVMTDSAGWMKV